MALHETYYSAKAIRNSSWIPSHLLQAIFPSHLPALTHIINTSLLTGTFPNAFKQARVTPLLKKTTLNTSLTDSYRPVSSEDAWTNELFSTSYPHFCQSIIYWMLTNQDSDVEIELRLLSVTEDLRIAKADSKSSGLILPNLSAAFDTVNHQILLSTLSSLGITGIPIRWFESYVNGRSFKVAWGGEDSTEHQLVTGVPQGSVLGPLLFSTYTTSLRPIIQAHGFSYHCYADDTQLYLSFRRDDLTVAARISGCLADISAWMKEHHLQLNLAKTELLVFPVPPTLQHNHPARFFYNYPIKFSQKSWCNFRWLSKTTLQKLFDLAGLHCITSERSGPSLHSMQHNLLSRPLSFQDWTTAMLF